MKGASIGSRKNRIKICTSADVVMDSETLTLVRTGLFDAWASIVPKKASRYTSDGYTIQQRPDFITHWIILNYRTDVDITIAAWIYEERRVSPPRWFKVINVVEVDPRTWRLEVRLTEKSDTGAIPQDPPTENGSGFKPYDDGVKL